MLFDTASTTNEEFAQPAVRDEGELGLALVFDWDENHFVMEDGSPVMVNKTEAAEEIKNMANIAYKFRIYPNKEQRDLFARTFGCVRFIYNQMLSDKIDCAKFLTWFIENYPGSATQTRNATPDFWKNFK